VRIVIVMDIESCKIIDGKKHMWDGKTYEGNSQAQEAGEKYQKNGFETQIIEEGGQYVVYTRRVVTEIVLEGEAPI
jgi:hypothetical protein